ncbi:MAG: lipoyl protein ligase domain-containing protein [Planctomycetota bacterium]
MDRSIGVQLKKWVSFHGMAININNDLGIFEHIVPCGLDDVVITSVEKETGKATGMDTVKDKLTMLCKAQWTSQEPRISYETGASGMGYNTGSYKRPNF